MRKTALVLLAIICVLLNAPVARGAELGDVFLEYTKEVGPAWNSRKEDPIAREERIKMIIRVIIERAAAKNTPAWGWSDDDLALAIFVKTFFESGRFNRDVHSGKIRGDKGRSVCLGQIMFGGNKLVGISPEATAKCIDAVIYHLTFHRARCLKNVTAVPNSWMIGKIFAGYGSGYSCNPLHKNKFGDKWVLPRMRLWSLLKERIS